MCNITRLYRVWKVEIVFVEINWNKIEYPALSNPKKDEVVDTYLEKFHHGITALDGYGGYSHHPVSYITAVVSSYEVGDVLEALKETDPKIIVSVTKVENFIGRFYNKPLD